MTTAPYPTGDQSIGLRPLSIIVSRRLVRPINAAYVERLAKKVAAVGLKPYPLSVTPDGVLYGGNHRYEAFTRLGLTECWMHIHEPQSLDREAIELNRASEDALPMSFVDDAELVWRKLAEGMTQQAVGDELGWSRGAVSNYAALGAICTAAWTIIATTSRAGGLPREEDGVASNATGVAFTEGLLRPIVSLTPDQQLELVTALAEGKIQKGRFKALAENYKARNEAGAWVREQLAGTDLIGRCLEEIAKGIYDAEQDARRAA